MYEKKEREVDNKPDAAIVELEIQAENKNKVATLELSNADGECEEDISDATRRRTQFLVDTVRNTLFHHHDKTITADNLREFCLNLTDVEMQPCLLICNLIIPYVPGKKNWFSLSYQLVFDLMASQLLFMTGYGKFYYIY